MDGFCGFTHVYFHNYKVHVRADTWDGGKCLCGLVDNRGLSCFSGLGRGGRRSWGLRKSLGPLTPSGAQGELVLLNGLFDPSAQAGLVEGLDERLLGRVVLCGCLLGFMVGTGPEHLDPQDGRQLKGREKQTTYKILWENTEIHLVVYYLYKGALATDEALYFEICLSEM